MPLYDRIEVLHLAKLIEETRPDIWAVLLKHEATDGIYDDHEEHAIFQFIKNVNSDLDTVKSNWMFLGIRDFAYAKISKKEF